MSYFLHWLANSPLASAAKIAASASIVWCLDNLTSFDLPAVAQVAILAAGPILVNWINPEDVRYGKGSDVIGFSSEES